MGIRQKLLFDIFFDVAGSVLYAVGIYCFFESASIAPGGVSGLAIMAKYLANVPVGLFSLLANIPLLLIASKKISKRFVLNSIKSLLIGSIIIDVIVTPYFPAYFGDRMLASIFGGVFSGLGMAIILMRGSSTGGTDILSLLIEQKFPHIQIGTAIMIVDFIVLGISILVFKNLESGLFGLVAIFCQARVIDIIIYGINKGRQILIISEKNREIADRIISEVKRGATFIGGKGAYEEKEREILLCVVRRAEYYLVKRIVHEIDHNAFMIASEATQILGEGFEPIVKKK